jgi:hypothetical protein
MILLWRAHTSSLRKRPARSAGHSHTVCRWAAVSAGPAAPVRKSLFRMTPPFATSVISATLAAAPACRRCAALIPFDSPWPGTADAGFSCITSMTAGTLRWPMGNSSTTAPQSAGFPPSRIRAYNARLNAILARIWSGGCVSAVAALQLAKESGFSSVPFCS